MQVIMEGPTPWSRKDQAHRRFWWGQRRVQGRRPCRPREVARQEWVCWAHMSCGVCFTQP